MTLLFMDGCHAGDFATKYSAVVGTPVRATATPPVTGGAYYTMNGDSVTRSFTASGEVYFHVRWRHTAGSVTLVVALYGDSAVTRHLTFRVNASNLLEVRRGTTSGTVLGTGATGLATGWHILEGRATISDTTGVVQVWLDGASSTELSLSSQDTKNGGTNTTIDGLSVEENGSAFDYTDLVIVNTSGSVNNARIGEVTVRTLTPNGNGNTSDLLGSDANSTDNYLLVDELPFSDADYVGSATAAQGDTYTMTDLTGSPTVKAVQVNMRIAKSDGGAILAKHRVRSGGTTYASGTKTPLTTFGTVYEIYETDPATSSAWTASNVNAVECGAEVA